MRTSQLLLVIGLTILLIGSLMTFTPVKEYANYFLILGLLLIVFRGSFSAREKLNKWDEKDKSYQNKDEKKQSDDEHA